MNTFKQVDEVQTKAEKLLAIIDEITQTTSAALQKAKEAIEHSQSMVPPLE